jgi:hypothetical protein
MKKQNKETKNVSFRNMLNSSLATSIAEFITLPICTIKTNFQNSDINCKKSIIDITKTIYEKKGIFGFYNSTVPAILSQTFSTSLKYVLYRKLNDTGLDFLRKIFPEKYKYDIVGMIDHKITYGLISGIVTSLITHPIDCLKIHIQMGTSLFHIGKLKINPYQGYTKSFSKVCVGACLYFPLFDYMNHKLKNSFMSAFLTSVIATIIIHPLDYLKIRHVYTKNYYIGTNPYHYYRGLSLNLMRVVPHFTILMTIISYLESKTMLNN